jgi:hypothetical protein
MAKKHKDDKKPEDKKRKKAVADDAMPRQADAGADTRENDMRRIAREAAWARMFGKNASKNPFGERA